MFLLTVSSPLQEHVETFAARTIAENKDDPNFQYVQVIFFFNDFRLTLSIHTHVFFSKFLGEPSRKCPQIFHSLPCDTLPSQTNTRTSTIDLHPLSPEYGTPP